MPTSQPREVEWRCPQCGAKNKSMADAAGNRKEVLRCKKCKWKGVLETVEVEDDGAPNEAPMGGVLAIVHQVERDRLLLGLVGYLCFCGLFVCILSLVRPFHQVYEVQNSIYEEIVVNAMDPGVANHEQTFMDTASWENYWDWVNTILMPKIYGEEYWEDFGEHARAPTTPVQKAPYSRFTIGRYNRVISAVRFRQVRVQPSLPRCARLAAGDFPSPYQHACETESFLVEKSCNTPVANHELSRPCWGGWSEAWQEVEYPNSIQKETLTQAADPARPEIHVNCLANCEAYYVNGFRTVEEWPEFNDSRLVNWVASHGQFEIDTVGNERCKGSCRVSKSEIRTGLSNVWGIDAVSAYCGDASNVPQATHGSCVGDVVDLPLEPQEAMERIATMQRERWANEATRMVAIELNTYNPNYDLLTASRFLIEVAEGGRFQPWVEIMSCRLSLFSDAWDNLRLFLEIAFCLFILYYFSVEGWELYTKHWQYFQDPWNFLELANLFIYATTMVLWFSHCLTRDTSPFEKRDVRNYHNLYGLVQEFNNVNAVSSFNLVYGNVRFFKYLRFNGKFRMLWLSLAYSMKAVVPIMIIFFIFLLAFSIAGHLVFGDELYVFHDLKDTIPYLVLSVQDGIEYQPLKDASPFYAPVWQVLWYVFATLILLNFLIAVVVDSFGRVKYVTSKQAEAVEEAMKNGATFPEGPVVYTLMEYCPRLVRQLSWWLHCVRLWMKRPPSKPQIKRDKKSLEEYNREVEERMQADEAQRRDLAVQWRRELKEEDARWGTRLQTHIELRDLHEAMSEVDIDSLWERCLAGIRNGEITLNGNDLMFLFGDSEVGAESWLTRVMKLGRLEPTHPERNQTTLIAIDDLRTSIARMGKELSKCSNILQDKHEDVRFHVQRGFVPGYGNDAGMAKNNDHARGFVDFLNHHATIYRGDEYDTHTDSDGSIGESSTELPLLPHNMDEAHAPEVQLPAQPDLPGRNPTMQPATSTKAPKKQPKSIAKNFSVRDAAKELHARRQLLRVEKDGLTAAPLQPLPSEGKANSTVDRYLKNSRPTPS